MADHNVSNPHPGFGKDPNILNEFGHTQYPKWIETKEVQKNSDGSDAKTKKGEPIYVRVLVNNEDEEAEVTGKAAGKKTGASAENTKAWGGNK